MAGVQPKFGFPGLKISHDVAAAITGGRVVEFAADREVQHAAAGSLKVAGVAMWDVPVARASIQGPQVSDEKPLVVARACVIKVTASGAVTAGDHLVAAANGLVAAAGATPDARTVIGQALEAAADGATLDAYIY